MEVKPATRNRIPEKRPQSISKPPISPLKKLKGEANQESISTAPKTSTTTGAQPPKVTNKLSNLVDEVPTESRRESTFKKINLI